MTAPKIHRDLPDEELIAHCWSPDAEFIGGTKELGRKVAKIDDGTVVKFGRSVTKFEFENLRIAKSLVDPKIVHIPEVYRYFEDNGGKFGYLRDRGYILMEYVYGTKIDPIEDPKLVRKVADIVAHFASIKGDVPGTLSRGPCGSILFPDNDEFTFETVQAMEVWINRRIFPHQSSKISLKGVELVLCHLDIAPRNLLWCEDGSICFLDWASAGFYPRSFEVAAQHYLLGFEKDFNQMLMDAMPPLSKDEEAQSRGIMIARGNSERYSFRKVSRPSRKRQAQLGSPLDLTAIKWDGLNPEPGALLPGLNMTVEELKNSDLSTVPPSILLHAPPIPFPIPPCSPEPASSS
ncbi:hypothetical protein FQN54_000275 [Arachnomyces sp. PD_36]|nr:hypothetical protein FQN54_000275 [Arachnomyces sp. PD_36]